MQFKLGSYGTAPSFFKGRPLRLELGVTCTCNRSAFMYLFGALAYGDV